MIVDSHCHASPVWFEPVETLLFQMDRCGVDRAVLVQALGQYDNGYQQACVAAHPDRLVSVVGVDPARDDAAEALERLAAEGAHGVRLRPVARSPGEDPLRIWRTAERLGLAVSCVGATAQFIDPAFAGLVAALPDLKIVLEHLGGVARPDADADVAPIWGLARLPNLYLKVPGLGQLAKRAPLLPSAGSPFEPGGEAALRRAVESFGPERLMWGSDFPPVASREGYANALNGPRAALAFLGEGALDAIFGGVAARVFATA